MADQCSLGAIFIGHNKCICKIRSPYIGPGHVTTLICLPSSPIRFVDVHARARASTRARARAIDDACVEACLVLVPHRQAASDHVPGPALSLSLFLSLSLSLCLPGPLPMWLPDVVRRLPALSPARPSSLAYCR